MHRTELKWGRVADWEIAAQNGLLDVRTGVMRPHRTEEMLDSVIPHVYDPSAEAGRWKTAITE